MVEFLGIGITELIQWAGYLGLFGIVFAESGILVGFFLPGDSLLFTAGILASQGIFDMWFLVPLLAVAAIAGDSAGYWTGKRLGPRLFEKENSRLFKKERLERAREFYNSHGGKTIVMARFMPFIRTFAPIVAGMTEMKYRRFLAFNVLGGIFWVALLTSMGFFLGRLIPDIDLYILPVIGLVILISFLPAGAHLLVKRRKGI